MTMMNVAIISKLYMIMQNILKGLFAGYVHKIKKIMKSAYQKIFNIRIK